MISKFLRPRSVVANQYGRRMSEFAKEMLHREEHAKKSENVYKWMTLIGVPLTLASVAYYAITGEMEHQKHPRPPHVPYAYMNLRIKPFFWGDGNHGIFHNPLVNPLPDGYEVEDPREHAEHH